MLSRRGNKRLKVTDGCRRQNATDCVVAGGTASGRNEIGANFRCPVEHRFAIDPVHVVSHYAVNDDDIDVEDEAIYEKTAIRKWIEKQRRNDPTSVVVVTPHRISLRLPIHYVAQPAVVKTVQDWIEEGKFAGEEAEQWMEARRTLTKIKKGNSASADDQFKIGNLYFYGDKNGFFSEDRCEAFKWYEKSFEKGSVMAQAMYGYCKLEGIGTVRDALMGMSQLESAARSGSDLAAYYLSKVHSSDKYNVRCQRIEIQFLKMVVDRKSRFKHLEADDVEAAKKRLEKLLIVITDSSE